MPKIPKQAISKRDGVINPQKSYFKQSQAEQYKKLSLTAMQSSYFKTRNCKSLCIFRILIISSLQSYQVFPGTEKYLEK